MAVATTVLGLTDRPRSYGPSPNRDPSQQTTHGLHRTKFGLRAKASGFKTLNPLPRDGRGRAAPPPSGLSSPDHGADPLRFLAVEGCSYSPAASPSAAAAIYPSAARTGTSPSPPTPANHLAPPTSLPSPGSSPNAGGTTRVSLPSSHLLRLPTASAESSGSCRRTPGRPFTSLSGPGSRVASATPSRPGALPSTSSLGAGGIPRPRRSLKILSCQRGCRKDRRALSMCCERLQGVTGLWGMECLMHSLGF